MVGASGAEGDTNWLDADELYFQAGADCEPDRPVYQGDVFADIPLPRLPDQLSPGASEIEFVPGPVMIVPHPCQCYNGDKLRKRLTVAPVYEVPNYSDFRPDRTGAKDKFALPDLPLRKGGGEFTPTTCVADFGNLVSISSLNINTRDRIACLSHEGLGLLAKRVMSFQLRASIDLSTGMSYTLSEWSESFLMQAWVRRFGTLKGYSNFLRTPVEIPGVDGGPAIPYEVRAMARDELLEMIATADLSV